MGKFVQGTTDGIYTGSGCNAQCFFCIDKGGYWKPKFTSFEEICARLDFLSSEGLVEGVVYEWWDFTIHPHLFQILEYGNKKWLKQTLQTNGILLSDVEFVRKLKSFGITTVNFSLHAHDKEVHDRMMGTTNTFWKVLSGMQNCLDEWMKITQNFVITSRNINQIEKMIVLSLKMKVTLLTYMLYIPVWKSESVDRNIAPDPVVSGRELSKMLKILSSVEQKAGRKMMNIKFYNIPLCLLDKEVLSEREYIVSKFRRTRETNEVTGRDFYFNDECTRCRRYNECSGLTLFYKTHYGDEYLKAL